MNVFIVKEALFSGSLGNKSNRSDSEKIEENILCFSHNWQAINYLDEHGFKETASYSSKNPCSVSIWAKEIKDNKYYIADIVETTLK